MSNPNDFNKKKDIPEPIYAQAIPVDQYGNPLPPPNSYTQPPAPQQIPPGVVAQVANNSNIARDAQGNALCRKCNAPYPLPQGSTSWRCRSCGELNNASIYGNECVLL